MMNNILFSKGLWVAGVVGFLSPLIPLMLWGNDAIDTTWYFYLVLAIIVMLGFVFFEEWKVLPVGLWLGGLLYTAFVVIVLPRSEASAWWQMGVFIMTLAILPVYVLVIIGKDLRRKWNSKHQVGA